MPCNPICNRLVEKWNGILKKIPKRLCAEQPKLWDTYLPAELFAYQKAKHESLGFSPFWVVVWMHIEMVNADSERIVD